MIVADRRKEIEDIMKASGFKVVISEGGVVGTVLDKKANGDANTGRGSFST